MSFSWLHPAHAEHAVNDASATVSVDDIIRRLVAERERACRPVTGFLVAVGFSHDAPPGPVSVLEAHRHLQQHKECLIGECPRKDAAFRVLVEAGKIRPDTSRARFPRPARRS